MKKVLQGLEAALVDEVGRDFRVDAALLAKLLAEGLGCERRSSCDGWCRHRCPVEHERHAWHARWRLLGRPGPRGGPPPAGLRAGTRDVLWDNGLCTPR
eukprot:9805733-Lingulodinium_polyedra.AAC.1